MKNRAVPQTDYSLASLLGTFSIFSCVGASVAMALQLAYSDSNVAFVIGNTMATHARKIMLLNMMLFGAVTAALPALYLFRRRSAWPKIVRAAKILSPLMLAWTLPLLLDWRIFENNTLLLVFAVGLVGFGLERTLRLCVSQFSLGARAESAGGGWAWAVVVVLSLGFCIYFTYGTLEQHYKLKTQSYDLAVYENVTYSLLWGDPFHTTPAMGPTGSHFSRHAHLLAYLTIPFYLLNRDATTFLFLQAVLLGLAVVPLFLLARRLIKHAVAAVVVAISYAIYAPLHGPLFYDFHYLTVAPFFIFWVFYAFEKQSRLGLGIAVALALLLREDIGAGLAMAFLYLLVSGRQPVRAAVYAALCAIYFIAMKFFIMPIFQVPTEGSYAYIYRDLLFSEGGGFSEVIMTIVSNPLYTLETLLKQEKLLYVMQLFVPILFVALRSMRGWLLFLFPALVTLFSTVGGPILQIGFQYCGHWVPYVFVGLVYVWAEWRHTCKDQTKLYACMGAVLLVGMIMSYHQGAIFQHNTFRGGFREIEFGVTAQDHQDHADLYALIEQIPPEAAVAATENEVPHLSNRRYCFTLRVHHYGAEYLLIRTEHALKAHTRPRVIDALRSGEYGLVDIRGAFSLWQWGHTKDRNGAGYQLLEVDADTLRGP